MKKLLLKIFSPFFNWLTKPENKTKQKTQKVTNVNTRETNCAARTNYVTTVINCIESVKYKNAYEISAETKLKLQVVHSAVHYLCEIGLVEKIKARVRVPQDFVKKNKYQTVYFYRKKSSQNKNDGTTT